MNPMEHYTRIDHEGLCTEYDAIVQNLLHVSMFWNLYRNFWRFLFHRTAVEDTRSGFFESL